MILCVVGATGLVGQKILEVLEESSLKIDKLLLCASEKSIGKEYLFKNKTNYIIPIEKAITYSPDITIFSAGSECSLKWAEKFALSGSYVIDNSSAWRMDKTKKLIVPEINSNELTINDKIIANPNCSTIQLMVVLGPLHKKYGIKRIVVSTYQSVTGSGIRGIQQLLNEREEEEVVPFYKYPIDMNCLPHGGEFCENGYTTEEMKLVNETRKILNAPLIGVSATVVRVPVLGGHSESVNVEFDNDFDLDDVFECLNNADGVIVQDQIDQNIYPMPLFAQDKDEVFVGRIRRDESQKNTLNMWIVADNLRKGAATNAAQIASYIENKFLNKE